MTLDEFGAFETIDPETLGEPMRAFFAAHWDFLAPAAYVKYRTRGPGVMVVPVREMELWAAGLETAGWRQHYIPFGEAYLDEAPVYDPESEFIVILLGDANYARLEKDAEQALLIGNGKMHYGVVAGGNPSPRALADQWLAEAAAQHA
jgi:hypothetical protein